MSIKTVSLETSLKLKEAGWTKETHKFHFKSPLNRIEDKINAPNTDELLEELPKHMALIIGLMADQKEWFAKWDMQNFYGSSLPEALASMWLYLKKEGLLK